ncbi:MAG: tetratricopeptide repeat protein [Hyphomicrobium sp.]
MAHLMRTVRPAKAAKITRVLASLTATLLLGACAQTSDLLGSSNLVTAQQDSDEAEKPEGTQNELQKATAYWGQEYAKKPSELKPALNYARNLKALGEKQKALAVLQQAGSLHDGDKELAGEYGRLALELEQVNVAGRMLAIADDPAKPDWKIISARGTVLAKQGKFKDAIPFYERALAMSNNQASVLNNLAMAHAMSGDAKKAEELLRQASNTTGASSAKVKQNLALVLGLQGRYDEAKTMTAGLTSASTDASQNVDMLRNFVKVPAQKAPVALAGGPVPDFKTQVSRAIATAPAAPVAGEAGKPDAYVAPQFKPATLDTASAAAADWKTNVAATHAPQSELKGFSP